MTLMHPHMIKLLSLSGLTLGLLAASQGVRADEVKAPTFTAEPCCSLCPAAHDAKKQEAEAEKAALAEHALHDAKARPPIVPGGEATASVAPDAGGEAPAAPEGRVIAPVRKEP